MDDFRWYSKNIAGSAAVSEQQEKHPPWFSTFESPFSGKLVIADAKIAPVFLAAVTLCISVAIPLLLVRLPKALAVAWCFISDRKKRCPESPSRNNFGSWHLPVMLANCNLLLSDLAMSLLASYQHLQQSEILRSVSFIVLGVFLLAAAVLTPLVALLISREVMYGFAGAQVGPCVAQYNFSIGAKNYIDRGLDHHLRSYELLPWIPRFNYSWIENNKIYFAAKPVKEPTSRVAYELLDKCLLNDKVLCDHRFYRTHKVSVEISPAQMGLWYDDSWKLKLNGYCLRLNSTSISRETDRNFPAYTYNFQFAPDAQKLDSADANCLYDPQTSGSWSLGQGEFQRFRRRKNTITDSFFVNGDEDRKYPCYKWRDSLRALDADSMTVITVLPSHEQINQLDGDELYLPPLPDGDFSYKPDEVAHILCWEELYLHTMDGKSFKTSTSWANRSALIARHGLPRGLNPLLHMANTEFIVKPIRFLRGSSSLLQNVAETSRWEFNPTNAAPVPFGAEMHRWAHVGAMDIASKATRTSVGFYSRGDFDAVAKMEREGNSNEELQDLCDAVRTTQDGTITLPLDKIICILVLLCVAIFWWALERICVMIATRGVSGPGGIFRSFLMLPAATPVSLAASVESALLAAKGWGSHENERVMGSVSGHPLLRSVGQNTGRPSITMGRDVIPNRLIILEVPPYPKLLHRMATVLLEYLQAFLLLLDLLFHLFILFQHLYKEEFVIRTFIIFSPWSLFHALGSDGFI
ncbi:hypothetical protein FACUT_6806 [Fusarium acutatum]|uniref:Uncharacterized protein n=1 Tax=Fusarium acutatum TaxID=78861 RepID=A0A8H4JNF4_9HYPO|nr:hypothetical protein FACUT_6806 [Fusarium acutatum]